MEAAEELGLRGRKLAQLLGELDLERARRGHRAAVDAEATALFWWRLLNLARSRSVHLPTPPGRSE